MHICNFFVSRETDWRSRAASPGLQYPKSITAWSAYGLRPLHQQIFASSSTGRTQICCPRRPALEFERVYTNNKSTPKNGMLLFCLWATKKIFFAILRMTSNSHINHGESRVYHQNFSFVYHHCESFLIHAKA